MNPWWRPTGARQLSAVRPFRSYPVWRDDHSSGHGAARAGIRRSCARWRRNRAHRAGHKGRAAFRDLVYRNNPPTAPRRPGRRSLPDGPACRGPLPPVCRSQARRRLCRRCRRALQPCQTPSCAAFGLCGHTLAVATARQPAGRLRRPLVAEPRDRRRHRLPAVIVRPCQAGRIAASAGIAPSRGVRNAWRAVRPDRQVHRLRAAGQRHRSLGSASAQAPLPCRNEVGPRPVACALQTPSQPRRPSRTGGNAAGRGVAPSSSGQAPLSSGRDRDGTFPAGRSPPCFRPVAPAGKGGACHSPRCRPCLAYRLQQAAGPLGMARSARTAHRLPARHPAACPGKFLGGHRRGPCRPVRPRPAGRITGADPAGGHAPLIPWGYL